MNAISVCIKEWETQIFFSRRCSVRTLSFPNQFPSVPEGPPCSNLVTSFGKYASEKIRLFVWRMLKYLGECLFIYSSWMKYNHFNTSSRLGLLHFKPNESHFRICGGLPCRANEGATRGRRANAIIIYILYFASSFRCCCVCLIWKMFACMHAYCKRPRRAWCPPLHKCAALFYAFYAFYQCVRLEYGDAVVNCCIYYA